MKRLLSILFATVIIVSHINSQNPQHKSGVTFKKLFLDYQTLNGGKFTNFDEYRHGFEIGYQRLLSNNVNLVLPARYGIVESHFDSINCLKKRIASLDIQFQYQFNQNQKRITPYIFGGLGGVHEDEGEVNVQVPVGLGFYLQIAPKAFIHFQSEFRYSFLEERNNLQHGIGFTYLLGKTMEEKPIQPEQKLDSDNDGIPDELDLCPNAFGAKELNGCPDKDEDGIPDYLDKCPDFKGLKEFSGCPDTDGDGISDNEDECPNVAGTAANKGCPEKIEPPKVVDTDGDGVPDLEDKCPNVAGTIANKGCPEKIEPPKVVDTDGDGVPDQDDKCPTEKGSTLTMGCPDRDGDGVADKDDKCPDNPGLKIYYGCPDTDGDGIDDSRDKCPKVAGTVANDGCPEIKSADKKTLEVAMQAVQFETGSSVLKPESSIVLTQIADIMARYPDFNMTISGHTDNTGSSPANQLLSEKRANSCFDFLVKKGISPDRISATGYGESRPITSNDTPKGRTLNRRVEFNLIPRQ